MPDGCWTLQDVKERVPVVRDVMRTGGSVADALVALANHMRLVDEHMGFLESIRPRKVRQDGMDYVWRCPDDMIPAERVKGQP